MSVLPFLHRVHQHRYRLHCKLSSIDGDVRETPRDAVDWSAATQYRYACISEGTKR